MSLSHLSETRGALRRDHLLQTPDTFVRAPLPGMRGGTAVVHAGPALGAAFTQYTAELESGGTLGEAPGQRFVYVLKGDIAIDGVPFAAGEYAFIPESDYRSVEAILPSCIEVIEKRYQAMGDGVSPDFVKGRECDVTPEALAEGDSVLMRKLLPENDAYDFAMNTMTFQPGASLSFVEMHIMEHGLLLLEGGGVYRLGESWYPVSAGDFIWMAPYCPQWFGALGRTPTKYLLYKDWNRHPL